MTIYKFLDTDKELIANQMENVENVSFRDTMIKFHALSIQNVLSSLVSKCKNCSISVTEDILSYVALTLAKQNYENDSKVVFNNSFKSIFQNELSKKEQIRILKGAQLTVTELLSVFNFAEVCGYKFSHYMWKGEPKSVKNGKLPSFMHLREDGCVEYSGETTLTGGQMRTIIEQADVLIARIFDNGIHWHCFLQTYKGLKGMESGVQGCRPHLHYISDSFGISKDDLITMIKTGKYPNTPVHIPLLNT